MQTLPALRGTELERASAATIRVRLLKIGAAIVRNTRRVSILPASQIPHSRRRAQFEATERTDAQAPIEQPVHELAAPLSRHPVPMTAVTDRTLPT